MTAKSEKISRAAIRAVFVLYALVLLRFTLFKYAPLLRPWEGLFLRQRELSYVPFRATRQMMRGLSPLRLIENLAGNIILFVPFGLVFPLAFGARGSTVVWGFLTSVTIEALQYAFAMGAADIDDVILNTLGTVLGYLVYLIINVCFKDKAKMLTVMAVLLGLGLIAGTAVLYFAGYLMDGFPNITF